MLNLDEIRAHFPALASDTIYFDNPGGTQIAQEAIQRIDQYLRATNANHGGAFRTSRESDATVAEARQAVADFLNAARPEVRVRFDAEVGDLAAARDGEEYGAIGCEQVHL